MKMNVYEDFDFIDSKNIDNLFIGDVFYKKEDIETVFKSIKDVLSWFEKSQFSDFKKDSYLVLSDCPATAVHYVEYQEEVEKLYIHFHVLLIIDDFYRDDIVKPLLQKKDDRLFDLYFYSIFFLLHEFSHLIDALNMADFSLSIKDKYEKSVSRYFSYHEKLDKEYPNPFVLSKEEKIELQRKYREIPNEKKADEFSLSLLSYFQRK